ncbi:glycosyltransferase [Clostridium sp. JN-1]|uniref:glycosyltransferase n=1 Tax=Clostridium sp. JN-1 TaxID=2483110 RepID=UPI000F0B0159|nr:glycosyltransferase [Clostridium sp. JN-1]
MARICFLADADSIHTRKWVDYFSRLNNEIYLISMRGTNYAYQDNVKVIVVKPPFNSKLAYFTILLKIKSIVKSIKPDILHSHYATSYGLYGRISGYHPFIISVWGSDVYEFPKASSINAKLLKFILNGADAVCSTSVDMANETKKYYKKENITITPFGVDINKFNIKMPVLSNDYITIGVIKNLHKIYGIKYLIQAFSGLLNDTAKNLKLMVVGDGPERSNLEKLCSDLNISEYVEFTGNVDNVDVPDYINKMDIVCIPSLSESFGVSAVEACACGRPVVCTNVGGLKEIVFDDCNGYKVNPKDSTALKNKLKLLVEDEKKLKLFSGNAVRIAQEKYDWKHNAEIMNELYKKILNRGKN